jgi:phenylalanyl-tRNA synthetase beta chain
VGGIIDEDFRPSGPLTLALSVQATNGLLGTDLDRDRMTSLLESIEFNIQGAGDEELQVRVPSFRVDVSRPQDLMEEVARLSGYNQIPTTFPVLPAQGTSPSMTMVRRNQVRDILGGFGFSEAINYSFISADSCDRILLDADDPRRQHIALLNPISEDQSVMRTTLVPGILEAAQRNIARQQNNLRLFEIGKVFLTQSEGPLPLEKEMLVGLWTGRRNHAAWHTRESACDFFDIKGIVQGLGLALGLGELSFTALTDDQCRYTRAGHTARIVHSARPLGIVGEVAPQVVETYDLKQPAFIFELDLELLGRRASDSKQMAPIPRFPATTRDITVIVDQCIESGDLLDTVARFGEKLVENLYLFDVFVGDPIPAGKKSISFRVIYRSAERTLEDETINAIHHRLTHRLIGEFGAALPV